MKKLVLPFLMGLLTSFFNVTSAASPDEIYQIISFSWDASEQKLVPFSIGSGTSIHNTGVITNKHVVYDTKNDQPLDFILLCRANRNKTQRSHCSIPAMATAYHPQIDVALVQPIDGDPLIPASYPETLKQSLKDRVRIYGFPYSDTDNAFGDENTLNKLKKWAETGGELAGLGDKLTITRGTIDTIYQDSYGNVAYYGTNAKGDFGSSGGGAFAYTGRYVGIPSYKDNEGNAILIAYSEIHDWVQEHKDLTAEVKPEVLTYYKKYIAPPPDIFEQQKKSPSRNYLHRRTITPSYQRRISQGTASAFTRSRTTPQRQTRTIYHSSPVLRYTGKP